MNYHVIPDSLGRYWMSYDGRIWWPFEEWCYHPWITIH